MNWINFLFYYAFVTAITGDVMLFIWLICRLLFLKLNPDLVYYMLRWVVIMFLLPVAYVSILMSRDGSYIWETRDLLEKFVFQINFRADYLQIAVIAWFTVTILNVWNHLKKMRAQYNLCKKSVPVDNLEMTAVFEELKSKLGIRGNVEFLWNEDVTSPIATGIRKRRVILPYDDFEGERLQVILLHELIHIKKHDLIYKAMTTVIVIIQNFNPPAYILVGLLNLWSEQDCDRKVVQRLASMGIRRSGYFQIIWTISEAAEKMSRDLCVFSMLFESKEMLERRVDFMKKYGKNLKTTSKIVTALLLLTFITISTRTSYAAGVGMANANDELFKKTQVVNINEQKSLSDQSEFSVTAEENALVPQVVMDDEIITRGSDGASFDWTIPAGTRYVTPEKFFKKGTKVSIALTVTPSDCVYWYGLMHTSGESTVCETTGAKSYTFTIEKTSFYRIMVENRSEDTEMHAVGGYTIEK